MAFNEAAKGLAYSRRFKFAERHCSRLLTKKLRGRPPAPDWSRGCTLSSRTRGDTTDTHGPLQRLLDPRAKQLPATPWDYDPPPAEEFELRPKARDDPAPNPAAYAPIPQEGPRSAVETSPFSRGYE